MKKITLEAFAELAKKDEALKKKIVEIATNGGGKQTEKMTALAAEYGYELEKKPTLEMEALSDDELENVAGGNELADAFCELMMWLIMEDDYICYNRIRLEED